MGMFTSGRTILYNIASFMAGGAATRVLSAVTLIIIGGQIGDVAFGRYFSSFATGSIASTLFTLGLDNWLLYRGGKENISHHTSVALSVNIVVGFVWVLGMLFIGRFLNPDVFSLMLILWTAVSIWLDQIAKTVWSAFKADLYNDWVALLTTLFQGGFLLIVILFRVWGVETAETYMLGRTIITGIICLITLLWYFRYYDWHSTSIETIKSALSEAKIFWLSDTFAQIYAHADITIVAQTLGKQGSTRYAPTNSLITSLFVFPTAGYAVLVPVLTKQYKHDKVIGKRILKFAIFLSLVVGLFSGIILWTFSHWFTIVLRNSTNFVVDSQILQILSWVFALKCLSFTLAAGIVAGEYQKYRVWVQLIAATFSIVASYVAAVQFGLIAVAWVYVMSECIIAVGYSLLLSHWWHST